MAAVILIAGPPASGKTTLARTFAERLCLPVLAKDRIKETLFDMLPADPDLSEPLGRASYQLLLRLVGELASGPGAFIVDNAFRTDDGPVLKRLLAGADVLHIHCHAASDTLCARLAQRLAAGERHPSHHHADVPALIASNIYAPCQIVANTLAVPTDDFDSEAYREAVAAESLANYARGPST